MEETDYLKMFASKVKTLREQLGLSKEKLAAEAGLHRTYISMVEQQERNPSLTCIYKIVKGLGIDIKDLFLFYCCPVNY